ncbi:MAG: cytochrome c [Chitinophagaceae bacterium]|nr:MAG: cytochrome c [Chitinophagaceae bacterium]
MSDCRKLAATLFVFIFFILYSCKHDEAAVKSSDQKFVSSKSTLDTVGFEDEYWKENDTISWKQSQQSEWPVKFGFGAKASAEDITKLDIDVRPDGTGLPSGKGISSEGRKIFALKCAVCHGATGSEGPQNKLVTTWPDTTRDKTIGNYWPYATTVFDYIRRSMPLNAPGSLSDADVYSLTAYLLAQNKIIDSSTTISARNLAKIEMPAKKYYVNDTRKGGHEIR